MSICFRCVVALPHEVTLYAYIYTFFEGVVAVYNNIQKYILLPILFQCRRYIQYMDLILYNMVIYFCTYAYVLYTKKKHFEFNIHATHSYAAVAEETLETSQHIDFIYLLKYICRVNEAFCWLVNDFHKCLHVLLYIFTVFT